jgi:hypothetical protein
VGFATVRSRVASAVVVAGLAGFLGFHGAAAVAYPGGTVCDASAPRYQVWGNFVCDVTQPRTSRGTDNGRSARLATAAFVFIGIAFVPFWWLRGALVGRWPGGVVSALGVLSAAATVALARVPSARWPLLHVATVFSATVPGLVAAVVGAVGLLRRGHRAAGLLGTAALLAGLGDAVGYARAVEAGIHCTPYLPVLQKAAAIALLAWMLTVAAIAARRSEVKTPAESRR